MGNQDKLFVKQLNSQLAAQGIKLSCVVEFGSSITGTDCSSSDLDWLVITSVPLADSHKRHWVGILRALGITALIISENCLKSDLNHSFIEAAPISMAVRSGKLLWGKIPTHKPMTQRQLVQGMMVIALGYLKNSQQIAPKVLIKELVRGCSLVWFLENRCPFVCLYSTGHLTHHLLFENHKIDPNDLLLKYLFESNFCFRWLEGEDLNPMPDDRISTWIQYISDRIAPFLCQLKALNLRPISQEAYSFQSYSTIAHNLVWREVAPGSWYPEDLDCKDFLNCFILGKKVI